MNEFTSAPEPVESVIVLTDESSRLPNDKRCPNCQAAPLRRVAMSGGFGGDVVYGCDRCGHSPWEVR